MALLCELSFPWSAEVREVGPTEDRLLPQADVTLFLGLQMGQEKALSARENKAQGILPYVLDALLGSCISQEGTDNLCFYFI